MGEEVVERTTSAQIAEIENSKWRGRPAKTIFFGGGTPTFLSADRQAALLAAVVAVHPPIEGCEITTEANPGTVDAEKFQVLRQAGFNRLSLGAQSFFEDDLVALGRVHRVGEIDRAVAAAREAGFDNLNLDLMFGLPNQSLRGWNANLERALGLGPEHLSLYCLTIEPNTAFYKQRNTLPLPNDEAQVSMYAACEDRLEVAGYAQYEISNYCKPGYECRHNLEYWTGAEYLGYGPGAVGCTDDQGVRTRYTNVKHPVRYAEAVESGAPIAYESEALDSDALRLEAIMLGLRLNQGVPLDSLNGQKLPDLRDRGWIESDDAFVRLTREGRNFCSEVTLALI